MVEYSIRNPFRATDASDTNLMYRELDVEFREGGSVLPQ